MKKLNLNILKILIPIFIFAIYSVLNMINAKYISNDFSNYYIKQIIWFLLGIVIIIVISKFKIKYLFKYSYIIYAVNLILLLLVLFWGKEVNGTRAWFDLKYMAFQPSETMKLALLLFLSSIISKYKKNNIKNEFLLILKILMITLAPAILTFLEPDTGAVIIYFVIALMILFASKIHLHWFIFGSVIIILLIGGFIYFYHNYQEKFVDIFGTSFFYRMDRITNYGEGLQIENALVAIGSAGIFGTGIKTSAIYFPEAPTDFVFALSVSNFGLLGGIIIILSYCTLFITLIKMAQKEKRIIYKFFIVGFIGMFIYQTMQNIFMNIGIFPIIGITLPFLSYGGTSMLLYFLCMAIIINIGFKEKYPIMDI